MPAVFNRASLCIMSKPHDPAHPRTPTHAHAKPAGGRGAIRGALRAWAAQGIPLRVIDSFLHANKTTGFDCPGCAFPDLPGKPLVDSCEQGQKAIAWEMTRKATGADFFAGKSPDDLRALSDFELENHGRLTTPILYEKSAGRFRAIDWPQAFALIGRELAALDPEQVAFYASGRSSNEAAFLWQLLARAYGSANLPDSSNFCHEPSGYALKDVIGIGKGTCTLEDFSQADLFIVIGQNPASNHPRMMGALHEAKQRGAKVLVLNPLRERGFTNFSDPKNVGELIRNRGLAIADEIFQVQIGGDLAALKGVMKALLDMEQAQPGTVLDRTFIAEHTQGFAALCTDIAASDWPVLEQASGLSRAQMECIAGHYARAGRCIISWCMGITHHPAAVATVQQIVNLLLLRGQIGMAGAGALPVRGHSNVQGDRTMGATSKVVAQWLDNLEATFPGLQVTRTAGRDAVGVIHGLFDGSTRALFTLGGNFGVAAPDAPRVLDALSNTRLTVHIATKLNRTHCYPGEIGLLLPTLGRTDIDQRGGHLQIISTEDSMSNVRASRGRQTPLSDQQMSEPAIVAHIGAQLAVHGRAHAANVPWLALADDYAQIRELIERCQREVTAGFEDYNRKLAEQGRFHLPNSATQRRWRTASGKAEFRVHPLLTDGPVQRARARLGDQVLTLMTLRSHDQFNTTVYGYDDRYRDVYGDRRVLFLHAADAQARGLSAGDRVDIEAISDDGIARRVDNFRVVFQDIARGCAAAYFPEASALVALDNCSAQTRTPAYKEVPVLIQRRS